MKREKKALFYLLYAFFLLLVSAVGLYVGIRYLLPQDAVPVNLPDYDAVHKFDPGRVGGHLLPDLNLKVLTERAGESVDFITNSKGFRNTREFDYRPSEGTTRIIFVGDSFVDGMRTDQEKTIGYLLERYLNEGADPGRRYEVLISGHNNPTNAWYWYQEHGWKYHPHIVLLGATLGNDLTWYSYNSSFLPKTGSDGSIALQLAPDPRQTGSENMKLMLPQDAFTEEGPLDRIHQWEMDVRVWLAARSFIFSQWVPPVISPGENYRRHVHAGGFLTSLGLFYRPQMDEIRVMYEDFEAVLSGFRVAVERSGAQFVMALFPTRMQVSPSDWRLLCRAFSFDEGKFDLDYPNTRIAQFCRQSAMTCIDLLPELRRLDGDGTGPLFRGRGDMHFNEAGNAAVARRLAELIRP